MFNVIHLIKKDFSVYRRDEERVYDLRTLENIAGKTNEKFISEEYTHFITELIPENLSFFEKRQWINFKTQTIRGSVMHQYVVNDWVVWIYHDLRYQKKAKALVYAKVLYLKKIVNDDIDELELWIIYEKGEYLAIGLLNTNPLFCETYQSKDKIENKIEELQSRLYKFTNSICCLRTFNCELNAGKYQEVVRDISLKSVQNYLCPQFLQQSILCGMYCFVILSLSFYLNIESCKSKKEVYDLQSNLLIYQNKLKELASISHIKNVVAQDSKRY